MTFILAGNLLHQVAATLPKNARKSFQQNALSFKPNSPEELIRTRNLTLHHGTTSSINVSKLTKLETETFLRQEYLDSFAQYRKHVKVFASPKRSSRRYHQGVEKSPRHSTY